MIKQGEIDATRKPVAGKTLYIWSPICPNVKEIILVNPPYAKSKRQPLYGVSQDPETIRRLMARKPTRLEPKKKK
jgi:hypothetical protein